MTWTKPGHAWRASDVPGYSPQAARNAAASGAWDALKDVSWPPQQADFDEDTYRRVSIERGLGQGGRSWPGDTRTAKLDGRVVDVCGMSHDDVRKLKESEKINMLVDNERQKYITPLQKISEFTETFRGFVAYPTTLDELVRLVKTIVAMAHGDTLFTNRHCVVVDARGVLKRRGEYLEAESKGKIGNLENFYCGRW